MDEGMTAENGSDGSDVHMELPRVDSGPMLRAAISGGIMVVFIASLALMTYAAKW